MKLKDEILSVYAGPSCSGRNLKIGRHWGTTKNKRIEIIVYSNEEALFLHRKLGEFLKERGVNNESIKAPCAKSS